MGFGKSVDIAEIGANNVGSDVELGGWVEDIRKMAKVSFLTLRDRTGITQIVVRGQMYPEDLTKQSVVTVSGTVQETKARDYNFEVLAKQITVLSHASRKLPVDPLGRLESGIDNRLNARALDMRNQKTAAVFKIRHHALHSIRSTMEESGFLEITTPKIIASASEGGADLFSMEYFGETAYLAQSPQLYKEQMTLGLERVYEIANFYRAENSHTGRHLTEFASVDIEAAFMDYTDVMDVLEKIIVNTYAYVSEKCTTELKLLDVQMQIPKAPFERVTYSSLLDELRAKGEDLKFGDDLQDAHLRTAGKIHPGFYFLTDWPLKLKPFYIREKDGDGKLSRSFDLQFGHLELSSGGTRLHDPAVLKERLMEQDLNPENFKDHLETFEWGMPPHSGWGLGLDRFVSVLSGHDNVRESVLYPRDPDRLRP